MEAQNLSQFQIFDEERLTKKDVFKEGKTKAFVLNFMPGQQLPTHNHPNTQVFITILEGNGICMINDVKHPISEKDVFHCNKDQMIGFENNSAGRLSVYVILAHDGSA
ncbi:cupin domain-containing protein [Bacillus piscicola]|uniref:cupin domain-containing protein n=1 Tax=Bacillus piscicola TaxID=1632684 RepID=UPI001F09D5D6|nr:cupin domain-containing protein [Bacillus piscicola]